jgi:signal transduction histidine kinase
VIGSRVGAPPGAPPTARQVGLSALLSLLPLAAVLPAIALAALLVWLLWTAQQSHERRELGLQATAAAVAIERELRTTVERLEVAAQWLVSDGAADGFEGWAGALLARQPDWVGLARIDADEGTLVWRDAVPVAVRGGGGDPLVAHLRAALGRGVQALSDVRDSPAGRAVIALSVPLGTQARLAALVDPARLRATLADGRGAPGTIVTVVDRDLRIVASSEASGRAFGSLPSESFRKVVSATPSGTLPERRTQDGVRVVGAWHPTESGWTVAVAVPMAHAEAALVRTVAALVGAGALLAAVAALAGVAIARRVGQGVADTAAAAGAMIDGVTPPARAPTAIRELGRLDAAIDAAGARLAAATAERERLLEGERLARERAEAASRERDEFLAALSHELRNPLAATVTALRLLERDDLDAGARVRLEATVRRQVGVLRRLIDDLLDVGAVIAGKVELAPAAFDLATLARQVVSDFEAGGRLADHRVAVEGGPAPVLADPVRIEQVVTNLLSNAVRYTPDGGAITVSTGLDGPWARLSVADTGIGIAPGAMDRVFEPFVQGDPESRRGGLGIGLTLARRLARLHGGDVEVASAGQGAGTTGTLRLPRAPSVG